MRKVLILKPPVVGFFALVPTENQVIGQKRLPTLLPLLLLLWKWAFACTTGWVVHTFLLPHEDQSVCDGISGKN